MPTRKSYSRRQILQALGFGAGATALAACTTEPTKATSGTGDPIADGINKFEDSTYPDNKKLYEGLADSQSPHTLVVTCSDSRIDAETLLSAKPGELFHLRDIANIIPHASKPEFGVLAPVEYAVSSLGFPLSLLSDTPIVVVWQRCSISMSMHRSCRLVMID
ncbi:carbonic anhydrase [Corynebacterium silvaticum]|uniref:Carbonic anhydrase n=1 Tax=Corynebacterium silvaticum TaxID=2320431 RepID=A0ACD4PYI2_9CORY|nr:carbonic anhydrase [Corynebacterium silvaticum]WCV10749.1 carbonic anhydrase [Corynebacterium silvaticum]